MAKENPIKNEGKPRRKRGMAFLQEKKAYVLEWFHKTTSKKELPKAANSTPISTISVPQSTGTLRIKRSRVFSAEELPLATKHTHVVAELVIESGATTEDKTYFLMNRLSEKECDAFLQKYPGFSEKKAKWKVVDEKILRVNISLSSAWVRGVLAGKSN